jgi:hypothetical protein
MIQIFLLEERDIINPNDWCRPLNLCTISLQGDSYSFESTYTGRPVNNLKWVKVKDAIGSCWFGKTIGEFNNPPMSIQQPQYYEFMRGSFPLNHVLDMKKFAEKII